MKRSFKFRVKNALKKREHIKTYRPTLPVAQSWFRTLNRGLFGGRLVEPDMRIGKLHAKDPYSNHNDNFYKFRDKFKQYGLALFR